MDKYPMRIFFAKRGRAIYISHLDLMRTMQRALKRSGLPVWYSEGFNPRIYLNFPLALSLGVIGEHEAVDVHLTETVTADEIVKQLDRVMPDGLEILSAASPVYPNKVIGSAAYSVVFSNNSNEDLAGMLERYLSQETIEVMKHSKRKGMISVDIKPHLEIRNVTMSDNDMTIDFVLPSGLELNLNASVFIDSFSKWCNDNDVDISYKCLKRTKIFCVDGAEFA